MSALAPILERFRLAPSRTPSLVVTVYGDVVAPRGGSLWLGTLLQITGALGIGEGAVRTAMSRLAADGWLDRSRVGRNSFYRLSGRGRTVFAEATRHIYDPEPPAWDGWLTFALLEPGPDRDALAASCLARGYGAVSPDLLLAPIGRTPEEDGAGPGLVTLRSKVGSGEAARLAARAWSLDRAAEAYRRFVEEFRPLEDALAGGRGMTDLDALLARILAIHDYRRAILRDPILPAELLPPGWPGDAARAVCGRLYRRLLPASERWLDAHGTAEAGAFPAADPGLAARFGTASTCYRANL